MHDIAERHAAAIEAARVAGRLLSAYYGDRSALVIEQKGANDFVSRADREAEAAIIDHLKARFPGDGFVGEETGASRLAGASAVWVIDPLDGTTNFLKGAHNWCVSIGLVVDGIISAGVVYDPVREEMFAGVIGGGARLNGAPIAVSTVTDPANGTIGIGYVPRVGVERFCADTARLLETGLSFRQIGAGALMLAYTAAGRIDGYWERHMWPWDAIGGVAVIRAAGGIVSDYPTGDGLLEGGAVLAANTKLYENLEPLLGKARLA